MYCGDDWPVLSNYAEALAWYQSREPYKRGRSKGLRPLGRNRRYDRSLIEVGNHAEKGGSVILSFHGTPLITFYEGGDILLCHGGHETVGTMEFMNAVLYHRFKSENPQKWAGMTRRRGKLYFSDGRGQDHRFDRFLHLSQTNEVTGTATEQAWVLDKERMAKVRKHYAEFTEYLTYYAQMSGSRMASALVQQKKLSVAKSHLRWRAGTEIREREEFYHMLNLAMFVTGDDKFANFMPLAEQLIVNAADQQYDYQAQEYKYVITPQMARDFFYELCRYHFAAYLFKKEVVPQGKVVLDESSKYVQYKSEAAPLPFAV